MGDRESSVVHVLRTSSLLESRADRYADDLKAVGRRGSPRFALEIERWREEERSHGVRLRGLAERLDPAFDFASLFERYERLVPYHEPGEGPLAEELVERCVVEALACMLYRSLADATRNADARRVFRALAADEARHYTMFSHLLVEEEARSGKLDVTRRSLVAVRRALELQDAQIAGASAIVAGRTPALDDRSVRREAHQYALHVHRLLERRHLRDVAPLLVRAASPGARPKRGARAALGLALSVARHVRHGWARLALATREGAEGRLVPWRSASA